MDKYKPIKTLGQGAYGVVIKAVNEATQEVVAIKQETDVDTGRQYSNSVTHQVATSSAEYEEDQYYEEYDESYGEEYAQGSSDDKGKQRKTFLIDMMFLFVFMSYVL